jgi:hypothetical protein
MSMIIVLFALSLELIFVAGDTSCVVAQFKTCGLSNRPFDEDPGTIVEGCAPSRMSALFEVGLFPEDDGF